jgi:hypothetical protein
MRAPERQPSRTQDWRKFGVALGASLVLHGVLLRVGLARPDLVILVQHLLRRGFFLLGDRIHHEPALLGHLPDIGPGQIGLAQLGVVAEQRGGHGWLR